jgi:hypothetical protein
MVIARLMPETTIPAQLLLRRRQMALFTRPETIA